MTKRQRQDAAHAMMIAAQSPLGHRLGNAIADHAQTANAPLDTKTKASDYTTKAGAAYGKSLGWTLIAIEQDIAFQDQGEWKRRKLDLPLKMDLVFRTPDKKVVAVQCGGRYEAKAHREKFEGACFGRDASALYDEILWWGFVRGQAEPVEVERWG